MNKPDFQKYARNEFKFLVDCNGFTQTTTEPNMVRYESTEVLIEINYSGRGEIDVIIDTNPPAHRFQFRLFLRVFYPDLERGLGYGIANTDEEICRELNRFSNVLQRYGKPLLNHDRLVFEKMKTVKWWELPS